MEHALRRGGPVQVTLTYEADPSVDEVYLGSAAVRSRLLELGFVETAMSSSDERPAGLRCMEHALFRDSPASAPTVSIAEGLAVAALPREKELAGWWPAGSASSWNRGCPRKRS